MNAPTVRELSALRAGQVVLVGGNRYVEVDAELAAAFRPGDRVIADPTAGVLLHVPALDHALVTDAVDRASVAFAELAGCDEDAISACFTRFAELLADDDAFAPIAAANASDVAAARARGRSTTRLELSASMRTGMIEGLRGWASSPIRREGLERRIDHDGWSVEAWRAPLGVVGFVFEGRPNVFADAVGVLRTGNTVVFRIGSDALGTAQAIVDHALAPALHAAGLPAGAAVLVASRSRATGWALFSDPRLALAVARGSGSAVAQLGAVARQAGVPVSLHGTGGAWMVAADDAPVERFRAAVVHSLDRKVCNTLNVCCITAVRAHDLVPVFVDAVREAAARRGVGARLHVTSTVPIAADLRREIVSVERADGRRDEPFVSAIDVDDLGHEWEWEGSPEVSLHVCDDVDAAVDLCNRHSPHFVASLVSASEHAHHEFYARVDAPFVGDGFTRWVDGQYALGAPELGLSNWQTGRMLARGGILSGDSIHTVRYRATVTDPELHR